MDLYITRVYAFSNRFFFGFIGNMILVLGTYLLLAFSREGSSIVNC